MIKDFEKFALSERRVSPTMLDRYAIGTMASVNPVIIEEKQLKATAMDVFSRLMMDRIIFLGQAIDDEVANIVTAQLLYLASVDPKSEISIYLNTCGGMVYSGLGIYDTMQLIGPPVSTICTGMAASMGAVLLCSGEKGMRAALPHSRIMIHQPLGGFSGQTTDILIEAREIEKIRKELCTILSTHTGQSYEKVFADGDRNYWMTAEEALEYGMIDSILSREGNGIFNNNKKSL